jgi:hypothetical protein
MRRPWFAAEADQVAGDACRTPESNAERRACRTRSRSIPSARDRGEPRHGFNITRRLGAVLGPALRFVGPHRDLMRAFAEGVTDDHVENQPAARARSVTETEGALISGIRCPGAAGWVPDRGEPAENKAVRQGCRPASPNSTEEATARLSQFARVYEDELTIARCLGAQVLTAASRRFLRLTGNKPDRSALSAPRPGSSWGKRWRPCVPPHHDHVAAPKPA